METEKAFFQANSRRSLFARLGHFAYRYRRTVISIWGVVLLLSLALTPRLDSALKGAGMVYEAGKAKRAEQLLQQELKVAPDALTLVFQSAQDQTLDAHKTDIDQLVNQIRNLPSVNSIVSSVERPEYRSADGSTQYSVINLKTSGSEAVPILDRIEQVLTESHHRNLKTFLTGKPVVDRDAQRISKKDLGKAELFALPLTLVALLFVFGSVVAAAMPVAMGVMTVSVTFGLLYFVTLRMDLSVFALNITSMLGLG